MECIVNKTIMYISYYVDIVVFFTLMYYADKVGSTVSLRCTCALAMFVSILCSHKCGIICTRFQASMFSSSMVFMWWKITGK